MFLEITFPNSFMITRITNSFMNRLYMFLKGPYKISRQFARTLIERVEWVGGAAESKKLSDDKNV